MLGDKTNQVEVRGFSFIKEIFDQRNWPFPMFVELDRPCTAKELVEKLELPVDKIEAVFINGSAGPLTGMVKPGDRVAFVPPGTPGPYRVILGIVNKPGEGE